MKIWQIKDPKERSAAYSAHSCGRKQVSAQWLFNNPDEQGYDFNYESEEFGLDPWRVIGGADALVDGSKIILWLGTCSEKEVSPNYPVYVKA